MAYTTTYPGDNDVIKAGPNCDGCPAAVSGECEAYRAFEAVSILGQKAVDTFTPGLRSTGREISEGMKHCRGVKAANQFILEDSMDHGRIASSVRVVLATAGMVFRDSGGEGTFPVPTPLEWEQHIRKPGRPQDRTASGLWKPMEAGLVSPPA